MSRHHSAAALVRSALLLVLVAGCGGNDTYNPTVKPGGVLADFTHTAPNPSATAVGGVTNVRYEMILTSVGGFSAPVTLSVSDLPTGLGHSFDQATVTPTAEGVHVTLTLNETDDFDDSAGTFPFVVNSTGGGCSHHVHLTLVLSAEQDVGLSVSPLSQTVTQGDTTTYTVTVASDGGFSSPVTLSVSGVPSHTTAALTPALVTPTSDGVTSTLTIYTTGPGQDQSPTPAGTHTLTVTGTGGGKTRTAPATLYVNEPVPGDLNGTIK